MTNPQRSRPRRARRAPLTRKLGNELRASERRDAAAREQLRVANAAKMRAVHAAAVRAETRDLIAQTLGMPAAVVEYVAGGTR